MANFFKRISRRSSHPQDVSPSFFNDDQAEPSTSRFWSKDQIPIDDVKGLELPTSNSFYKKSKKKSKDLKPVYISFYKNLLIASKNKEWKNGPYKSVDLSKYFIVFKRLATPTNKYAATFTLSYNSKQILLSSKTIEEVDQFFEKVKKYIIQVNFEDKYDVHRKLGSGSYASVYRVTDKVTDDEYAAKFFEIAAFKDYNRSKLAIKNEIKIHRQLQHGKICELYEVYETPTHLILLMEHAQGERLINYVIENAPLPEKQAKGLIKDLLEAVAYTHSLGIIHRDIKLENVMINPAQTDSERPIIKLIDFGLAATTNNIELFKRSGTPGYVAPEVLTEDTYDTQADVFSLGVILFTMVSGRSPFVGSDRTIVLRLNRRCEFSFKPKHWDTKTADCINLVKRMMEAKPTDRITVQQALNHRWLSLLNIHGSQSLKVLVPRGLGQKRSLSPNHGSNDYDQDLMRTSEKTNTASRDNNLLVRNRPANLLLKSNSQTNRSSSTRNGELSSPARDPLLRSPTPNLLQIPQNNMMFGSFETEDEKGELSVVDDGINKASLRTFYKLCSDYNTEEVKSEGLLNTPKRSLVLALNGIEHNLVPTESSDIRAKISSYKELDKGLKSPFRLNSHSQEPSFNDIMESSKIPSCDLSSDHLEEGMAAKPKQPKALKASMLNVKQGQSPTRKSKAR